MSNKHAQKRNKLSGYFGVAKSISGRNQTYWTATMTVNRKMIIDKCFPYTDEGKIDAAKAVDLALIRNNLDPVNILKAIK